jgi:uncharacterized protein YegP (UPF0339 family)
MGKIEIFKGSDEQFYFKVVARNGETIAISEGYTTKQNCYKGIDSLKENAKSDVIDSTKK